MRKLTLLALACVVILLAFPAWSIRTLWACLTNERRAWRLLISGDQLANAAFNGFEDETISERAGRAQKRGEKWACVLCKFLDLFDKDHCEKSIGASQ